MDLDKLQIGANVRSGWQALDLGFLMARAWWFKLFLCGVLPAVTLFIPLLILFYDKPFIALFIIWWLKPFWERLPLYFGSRIIFGEQIAVYDVIGKIREIYSKDFFAWLLWRRFALQRALSAPVSVLEGLKGKSRTDRLNILIRKNIDIAFSNQLICFFFELIICFGLGTTLVFFVPDKFTYLLYDSFGQLTLIGKWIYSILAFAAMFVVMPFYTMAGFALYLNRRIELEAWDIEIAFRNLVVRKQGSSASLNTFLVSALLVTLLLTVVPSSSYAQMDYDRQTASQSIKEILKGEDFGHEETVQNWRFKNVVEENKDKIPDWLIDLVEWLSTQLKSSDINKAEDALISTAGWIKMLLILAFIGLVIYLLYHYRGPLKKLKLTKKDISKPEIMFGLDVTPESLPDDVPAQVLQLWNKSQHRESLGLLYRAALSHMIEQYELTFKPSHTEAECAALVRDQGVHSLSQYFEKITFAWCYLAYGHSIPETQLIEEMCENWPKEMISEID